MSWHLRTWFMLVADYHGEYELTDAQLREWAVLDTFDMLSPAYDCPQEISEVKKWFEKADLSEVDVRFGYNGIQARAIKPLAQGDK